MRKIVIGIVVLLVSGIGFFFAMPWVSEFHLQFTCKKPSENCVTRMRAMGHLWSQKGDLARATTWYERAATGGDTAAMFHLGWIYERTAFGFFKDYVQSIAGAARDGSDDDFEIAPNPTASRAIAWYRRAAERGFAPAMNNLGQLQLSGIATKGDRNEAVGWVLAAARAGNPVAAMYMSFAYLSGQGVSVNPSQAEYWSTWRPTAANSPDLLEPTFTRTSFMGEPLPAEKRAEFRAAAAEGRSVTTRFSPMTRRDPSLPTFKSVQRGIETQRRQDAR